MPELLKAEENPRKKSNKPLENTDENNVMNHIIWPEIYKLNNLRKIHTEITSQLEVKFAIKLIKRSYKKAKWVLPQIKDTTKRDEANSSIDRSAREALLKLLEYANGRDLSITWENPVELGKNVDRFRSLEQAELKKLSGMSDNNPLRQNIIRNAQKYEKIAEENRVKMIQIIDKILGDKE